MAMLNGSQTSPDALLQRIDAMMRELQEMRRMLLSQAGQSQEDLVEKLWGLLGQGSWEDYKNDLEWEYFL